MKYILMLVAVTVLSACDTFSQDHSSDSYITQAYVQQNYKTTNVPLTSCLNGGDIQHTGPQVTIYYCGSNACQILVTGGQEYGDPFNNCGF